jgi:hypothetical protein
VRNCWISSGAAAGILSLLEAITAVVTYVVLMAAAGVIYRWRTQPAQPDSTAAPKMPGRLFALGALAIGLAVGCAVALAAGATAVALPLGLGAGVASIYTGRRMRRLSQT